MGVSTYRNDAVPTRSDSATVVRYYLPSSLSDLTLAEKLLIERISVTVATHHLAHGGWRALGTSPH